MENQGYICGSCNKNYKEKFNFDRHKLCCEFFHKTQRERHNEIDISNDSLPTQREMYTLMQDLVLRIDKLEKENAKYRQMHNKKINIIDWLNTKTAPPSILFSKWVIEHVFSHVKDNLDVVFSCDLMTGVLKTFEKTIESTNETINKELPIRAIEGKNVSFYIFDYPIKSQNQKEGAIDVQPRWFKISNSDFDRYLAKLDHQFLVDFNRHWFSVHKEKVETDESYKDKYINYYKAILGGDRMSDETRYNKIRHKLHEKIKKRINSITEINIE
jgi:hypothetical protein